MVASYEFWVEDVMAQKFIGTLPLQGVKYSLMLDRPGKLDGTLALVDADLNVAQLDVGRRAIYVLRNGTIDFGGLLWTAPVPMGAQEVTVGAEGWEGYWDHRDIWTDRQFAATEQFVIVSTLIADAQDPSAVIDPATGATAGSGADLGITVGWDADSGVLRDRMEEYRYFKGKNLGTALRELAACDDGFDFGMTYSHDSSTIAKQLTLYYPFKGADHSDQLGWVYRDGEPGNVLDRGLGNDATKMAWRLRGWGAGNDVARLRSDQVDETNRGVFPFFDGQGSFSSVVDIGTLAENTAARLATNSSPNRMPQIKIDPDRDPNFESWTLGDIWNVTIDDGAYIQTDGPHRIVGYEVDTAADQVTLYLDSAA